MLSQVPPWARGTTCRPKRERQHPSSIADGQQIGSDDKCSGATRMFPQWRQGRRMQRVRRDWMSGEAPAASRGITRSGLKVSSPRQACYA